MAQDQFFLTKIFGPNTVEEKLDELIIECVMVPTNMAHLLQPLDLTTNGAMKKMEKRAFSEYFTNCIANELIKDPEKGVTTIEVDLKLSTLKPKHGNAMCDVRLFEVRERKEDHTFRMEGRWYCKCRR